MPHAHLLGVSGLVLLATLAGCSGSGKSSGPSAKSNQAPGEALRADDVRFFNALRLLNEWMAQSAMEGKPPSIAEVHERLNAMPVENVKDPALLEIHAHYLTFLTAVEPYADLDPKAKDFAEKKADAEALYQNFHKRLEDLEAQAERRYTGERRF